MTDFLLTYGSWALVAGAGQGLGAAFSIALARRGQNLIMVDQDEKALEKLAGEIGNRFNRDSICLKLDLSVHDNLPELVNTLKSVDCRLLVYNAAYGPVKPFLENSKEELDYYLSLNSRTPLHLIYRFIHERYGQSAGIIIMSSLAGLYGTNLVAPYGATKAFGFNLGEALYHEFKGTGMDVLACCAGATDTQNYRSTRPKYGLIKPAVMPPDRVVEEAIDHLGKTGLHIPGIRNRLAEVLFRRVFTRKKAAHIMNKTMRSMYRETIFKG